MWSACDIVAWQFKLKDSEKPTSSRLTVVELLPGTLGSILSTTKKKRRKEIIYFRTQQAHSAKDQVTNILSFS
jgi:hypothetical protein